MSRGDVDQQTLDLFVRDSFEMITDTVDVPTVDEGAFAFYGAPIIDREVA